MVNTWPNFLIVGAHKAGTTSLWQYLRDTQGVFMSEIKEPHFFSSQLRNSNYMKITREEHDYLKLFENGNGYNAVGEASTFYLWDEQSPKLIHSTLPDIKIIICLRDPVERAYSHYLDVKRVLIGKGEEFPSFIDCIKKDPRSMKAFDDSFLLVELGYYDVQIRRYLDLFGEQQIKFVIFEDFYMDPKNQFKQVLDFLGIDSPLPDSLGNNYNPYVIPRNKFILSLMRNKTIDGLIRRILPKRAKRVLANYVFVRGKKPEIDLDAKLLLRKHYSDTITRVEQILTRPLPWQK